MPTRLIMDILVECDLYINLDKIVFVSDRGADLVAALSGYSRYFCIAHMLNNIVAHASVPIEDLIAQISKVVKYGTQFESIEKLDIVRLN